MNRRIKISFRRHQGSRQGVIKIFASVRLPGVRNPKQLHLGYLPVHNGLPEKVPERIEMALRKHWQRLFHNEDVEIDWADFYQRKWVGNPTKAKRSKVDRSEAIVQITLWQKLDEELQIKRFGGSIAFEDVDEMVNADVKDDEARDTEDTSTFFNEGLRRLSDWLARQLQNHPAAEVAEWWAYEEVPRLLYRFYHYTEKNPNHPFSRNGLLKYLAANIARGYAVVQFLRQKRSFDALPPGSD